MFKISVVTLLLTITTFYNNIYCQSNHKWTDTDRKYLVDNLERTKNKIITETQNLTLAQWQFREDSTKWSISQVLEHLGLYERIFAQEADIMLSTKPDFLLDSLSFPDSTYLNWMNDPSPPTGADIHLLAQICRAVTSVGVSVPTNTVTK